MDDIAGDGDLDVAIGYYWSENQTGDGSQWQQHQVTPAWGKDARVIIYDMNDDGQVDIVLSHSKGQGRVAWFENPDWIEHPIESGNLNGAHSLEVADFDQDGAPDVFTGGCTRVGSSECYFIRIWTVVPLAANLMSHSDRKVRA